jgi:hypothetical protein
MSDGKSQLVQENDDFIFKSYKTDVSFSPKQAGSGDYRVSDDDSNAFVSVYRPLPGASRAIEDVVY